MNDEPRERNRLVNIETIIRERQCDFCDSWFEMTRPSRRFCRRSCQKAEGARRHRARKVHVPRGTYATVKP